MNKDSTRFLNARVQPPNSTRNGHSHTLGRLDGKSATLEYRIAPEIPDPTLQKFRYDSHYIPKGGVNIVSPFLEMKYNLSKENIKLQNQFTMRLERELLQEKREERAPIFQHYYCSGCNGLLFMEFDIVYHAPVYVSSILPNPSKLRIMEGDTSNVALWLPHGHHRPSESATIIDSLNLEP